MLGRQLIQGNNKNEFERNLKPETEREEERINDLM